MTPEELEKLNELTAKKTDTEKILYILYKEEGLDSKKIAENLLSDSLSSLSSLSKKKTTDTTDTTDKQTASFIRGTLSKYLKRLLDGNKIERDESVKPYTYKLSNTKRRKIEREIENELQKELEERQRIKREEEKKNFLLTSQLFWGNYIEKYVDMNNPDLIIDLRKIKELVSFDDSPVLDWLFDDPSSQIQILKKEYENRFYKEPNIILRGKERDTKTLKELREEKGLISIQAQIDFKTDVLKFKKAIRYECPSCGNIQRIINTEFPKETFKPLSVCACGRKGRFNEIGSEILIYQKILISDLDINLLPGEQPIQKNAIIKKDLLSPHNERKLNVGDKIQALGVLKEYTEKDNSSEILTYFEVLGFDFLDKKDIDDKFTDEEINQFAELKSRKNAIEDFANNLFFKHEGDLLAKKLCTLQMFSGFKKTDRQSIHLLLFGEPGTGKTNNFLEKINSFFYKTKKISQNNNTSAGLGVASVKNDFLGKNVVELGAIPQANKGFFLIDEINDIDKELFGTTIEAMEGCVVVSNKSGAKGTFPADIKVLATMNPVTEENVFLPETPLFDQPKGMTGKFIDRFDFVIPFVNKRSMEQVFKFRRKTANLKTEFDETFLKKYAIYAEKFEPEFPEHLREPFELIFVSYAKKEKRLSKQSEGRIFRKCENLVKAVARFHLSNVIKEEHIKIAGDIYLSYLNLVENYQNIGLNSFELDGGVSSSGAPPSSSALSKNASEINPCTYESEDEGVATSSSDSPSFEQATKFFGKGRKEFSEFVSFIGDEAKAEEFISKLTMSGVIYEPKRGFYEVLK